MALVCERSGVEVVGTLAELGEAVVRRLEGRGLGESGAKEKARHQDIKPGDIVLGSEEGLGG